MLRELLALVEMFIKESKAYALAAVFYVLLFPIAILVAFRYIVPGPMMVYLVSGTLVFDVMISMIVSLPQSIGYDREQGRLSMMISAGVPAWAYAMASSISSALASISGGLAIAGIAWALRATPFRAVDVPLLLVALVVSTFEGGSVGLLLASAIRNLRLLNQVAQVVGFAVAFFAPVYFPLSYVPAYLRPLAMLEPTTYSAAALRLALEGSPASLLWDLAAAAYGVVLIVAAGRVGVS